MKARLTKSIFAVAVSFFAVSLIVVTAVFYNLCSEAYRSELQNTANFIADSVEKSGAGFLEDIEFASEKRVTWVSSSGETLYDSGAPSKENTAAASRSAVLSDGSTVTVYAAGFTVLSLVTSALYPLITLVVLAIALSLLVAHRVSSRVVEPIKAINLEHLDYRNVYEELRPLAKRINEQNRKIYEQVDALKKEHGRRDTLRREFTANVSHELKTPLTSISGYAEIIHDGVVSEEDIKPFAGKIYDESQRMIALVGDILRLSELETKELSVVWERLNVFALCADIRERLLPIASAHGVTIGITGASCFVTGVRQVIEEIAYNLCDNAIKYNRPGGVVDMAVSQRGGHVLLSVSDTGIGIPQKDLDRIFERFYRVDKSRSRQIGGTGLGLSIVKHGASLHNAKIEISSELGSGTQIDILFPVENGEI